MVLTLAVALKSAAAWAGVLAADVDKPAGTMDDQFVYTLIVSGKAEGEPAFPSVDGVKVVQTQQSNNFRWINGESSRETTYAFVLEPTRTGRIVIPPISLKVDGATMSTQAITLQVGERADPRKNGATPEAFITRRLAKDSVYVGEPVFGTIILHHRVRLLDPRAEQRDAPGFRRETFDEQVPGEDTVNGVAYRTITLKEVWVGEKPGVATLPPFTITVRQPSVSRGLDFFDMDPVGKRRAVRSDPVTITVKPLPREGRPANFSGLAGVFTLEASVDKRQLKVGDSAVIRWTITGKGQTDAMADPALPLPPELRAYPDKARSESSLDAQWGLKGTRTQTVAVVPAAPGSFPLGRLDVVVFNTDTGRYETLSADLGTVDVTGEAAAAVPPSPRGNAGPTAPPADTAKTGEPAKDRGPGPETAKEGTFAREVYRDRSPEQGGQALSARERWTGWAVLSGFGILALGAMVVRWRRGGQAAARKGQHAAYRALSRALHAFAAPDAAGRPDAALRGLYEAFLAYVASRWRVPRSRLTPGDVLADPLTGDAAADAALSALLADFDRWQFSLTGLSADEARQLCDRIRSLADRWEKQETPWGRRA